jgi:hypothetical protein
MDESTVNIEAGRQSFRETLINYQRWDTVWTHLGSGLILPTYIPSAAIMASMRDCSSCVRRQHSQIPSGHCYWCTVRRAAGDTFVV